MRKIIMCCVGIAMSLTVLAQRKPQSPDAYRPKVHFSPAQGWMSDPNGMVYFDGEYHMCYQHIPDGPFTGTHWGHSVSRDLLHWEHLPIALSPDSLGFIYSGCSVFDKHNTSGFGTAENPPLIACYTYHDPQAKSKGAYPQSQALAYSLDRGRTWTKYANNPVLRSPGLDDFRDPKIMWNEKSEQWLMVLACGETIKFYSSKNCIDWSYESEFGQGTGSHVGPWECPDFFTVKVEGSSEQKSVLIVSVVNFADKDNFLSTSTQYFIGDFDGKTFTSNQKDTLWLDYGKDCYAGVTFDNVPDKRHIFVGWMGSHQYGGQAREMFTKTWAGAATFPREFNVVKESGGGYRLKIEPVKEIVDLYRAKVKYGRATVTESFDLSNKLPFDKAPVEINLNFDVSDKMPAKYGIRIRNNVGEYVALGYDRDAQQFYVDRTTAAAAKFHDKFDVVTTAPFSPTGKSMTWRLLVDMGSVELFVGDSKIAFSNIFFPSQPFDIIELFTENGSVNLKNATVFELKSIR